MLNRFACLKLLSEEIKDELVVVTLGVTGDEWAAINKRDANLLLSCMGYVTPVGIGLALSLPHRKVVVLESDGSLLLNLASLVTLALEKPDNLSVFVFDNECYESIGGVPSATAFGVDLAAMAQGAGVKTANAVRSLEEFRAAVKKALTVNELSFSVVKIKPGIENVPAKGADFSETKYRFVRHIEKIENISILALPSQERRDPHAWQKREA